MIWRTHLDCEVDDEVSSKTRNNPKNPKKKMLRTAMVSNRPILKTVLLVKELSLLQESFDDNPLYTEWRCS